MSAGRVVLIGAVHESLAALEAIASHGAADLVCVVTLSDEAAQGFSGVVDLAGAATRHRVEVLRVEDANAPASVAAIRARRPDLIAVVGWTRLIHDELLSVPPRGVIGFHASLLPRHRGRAPVNWSIIKGERETGNTLMLLNAGVDTGHIVDQRATAISDTDTCETVYERVAALGADMLADNLEPLLAGTAELREQDDSIADVLPKRTPAMGITDWRRTAREIHDWIRAQTHPYPGAFSHIGGREVMLWASRPPTDGAFDGGEPGELTAITDAGMTVATGRGSILITSVGDRGGPATPPAAWATGLPVAVGSRFDLPPTDVAEWALGRGPRPREGAR